MVAPVPVLDEQLVHRHGPRVHLPNGPDLRTGADCSFDPAKKRA